MERIIFQSYGSMDLTGMNQAEHDAEENLKANGIEEPTSEEVTQEVYDDEGFWYDAERSILDKVLDGRVLAIADIGRWNGRVNGYKMLGNNLNEVLDYFSCDDLKVYYDKHNIYSTAYHHDGTNYIEFREVREDRDVDKLLDKIYNNESISRQTLNYYTKPMAHYIQEIYGI